MFWKGFCLKQDATRSEAGGRGLRRAGVKAACDRREPAKGYALGRLFGTVRAHQQAPQGRLSARGRQGLFLKRDRARSGHLA